MKIKYIHLGKAITLKQVIGLNIKARRESLNLTQKEFSSAYNIPYISVNKMEQGKCSFKIDLLLKLAHIFKCESSDLYCTKDFEL